MANYSLARPMDFSALDVGRIQEQRQRQEYNALRNEGLRNELQDTERARQDKERVKQIMQSSVKPDGTMDYQSLVANLSREGYSEQALKLEQGLRESQAEQIKGQRQMLEEFSKLAGQVRDQTSLEMFRRAFPSQAEQLPTTYDETARQYFDTVSGNAAEAARKLAERKQDRANFLWETETRERTKQKYRDEGGGERLSAGEANMVRTLMELEGVSFEDAAARVRGGNAMVMPQSAAAVSDQDYATRARAAGYTDEQIAQALAQRQQAGGRNALAPATPSPMGATPAPPLAQQPAAPPPVPARPAAQGSPAAGEVARVRREARDQERGDLPEALRARISRGQVDPRAAQNMMQQEQRWASDPRVEKAREEFFNVYLTLPDEQKAAWFIRNQAFLPENAREQIRQEIAAIDKRRRLEGAQRSQVPAYISGGR